MTSRLIVIAACAAAGLCWASAVLGGMVAARTCAAVCAALATLVIRALVPPQATPTSPRYGVDRTVVRQPYPRFHQLVSVVEWARRDRRYHDRVLAPLLDQVASDVDDETLVQALRSEIADGLDRFERRGRRWT